MSISSGKPTINNFHLGTDAIGTLESTSHKFLGSSITLRGKQKDTFNTVKAHFLERLERIDNTLLRGEFKCKIYGQYLLGASRFTLTVHSLTKSDIENLDSICHKYIKKWCGIARCGNTDIIHSDKFLNIPSIAETYEQCQASAYISSRIKGDTIVNAALDSKLAHETTWTKKRSTIVTCHKTFTTSLEKSSIEGQDKYKAKETVAKQAKKLIKKHHQDLHNQKLGSLPMQGELLRLYTSSESDTEWKSAIYNLPKGVMSFILNSSLNSLPTMDNLKRWGKKLSNQCQLCRMPDYLSHTLAGCKVALEQGRYSFRHDSVLHVLHKLSINLTTESSGIEIYTDLQNNMAPTIPPEILPTAQRPDLVIVNKPQKTITIVELTVPYENNIVKEHNYKHEKYQYLIADLEGCGYDVTYFPIEIGCRGVITKDNKNRLYKLSKSLSGSPPKTKLQKSLLKELSLVSTMTSYAIFTARSYKLWIPRDILRIS